MAGVGPGDLQDLADDLLAAATDALDSIPTYAGLTDLNGAPDRAFTYPGRPIWDCCEQLVVHVENVTDRFALPKAVFEKINVPNLVVWIGRCAPKGEIKAQRFIPPPVAEMEAASRQHHADGWALWNHIWNMIRAETFLTRCTLVTVGTMTPFLTEAQDCVGWQLPFTIGLDGYEETLGP